MASTTGRFEFDTHNLGKIDFLPGAYDGTMKDLLVVGHINDLHTPLFVLKDDSNMEDGTMSQALPN